MAKTAPIAALAFLLSACSLDINDKRPVNIVACEAFSPIYVAEETIAKLDRDTKMEIAIHNRTHEKLCGKGK